MQALFRYTDMTEYAFADRLISAQDIRNNPPYPHPLSISKSPAPHSMLFVTRPCFCRPFIPTGIRLNFRSYGRLLRHAPPRPILNETAARYTRSRIVVCTVIG